ncbi:MAG: Maf family protein, partial [Christensenellaceae bacterium]
MIILASRSPRRFELLSMITKDFSVVPSNFDERSIDEKDPVELVKMLSRCKALAVDKALTDTVIGCDTIVFLNGEVFGIPKCKDDAFCTIKKLSGKTHSVITGVCILHKEKIIQFETETKVTFFELSDSEINSYIRFDEPYDKAGGYGIQGK